MRADLQTIELVLRRPNGHFYPPSYLISVMCHEVSFFCVVSLTTDGSHHREDCVTLALLIAAHESRPGLPESEV